MPCELTLRVSAMIWALVPGISTLTNTFMARRAIFRLSCCRSGISGLSGPFRDACGNAFAQLAVSMHENCQLGFGGKRLQILALSSQWENTVEIFKPLLR